MKLIRILPALFGGILLASSLAYGQGIPGLPISQPVNPATTNTGAPVPTSSAAQLNAVLPPPVDPAKSDTPVVFGSQIFAGRFAAQSYTGFNPNYVVAVGDRIALRMWGAVTFDAVQTVDPQGNIFIPNVGPIPVAGLRNQDLNVQVDSQIKRTFKANVGVYATLDAAQPVKIYVTGFVRAPGLYGGMSSDSVLNFLDKAGGIDPDRGSYLKVQVQRAGKLRAVVDLYKFLLSGQLEALQLQDGDTIVVLPRQYAVTVTGEAQNPYVFELAGPRIKVSDLLTLALPKARATHLSIGRNTGVEMKSEYYPLAKAQDVEVQSGDVVNFTADKYATTILIRIEGAQMGERSFVMSNGAKLRDLLGKLSPSPQANMESIQLFRKSVAQRQKKSLDMSLRNLEVAALTARSATSEEAALRKTESDMMLNYISRAQQIQPLGQVVLSDRKQAEEITLEDGDVIQIPEKRNLVLLSGEVLFPNAQVYSPRASTDDYIAMAGGFTQKADTSRLVILRADGSVSSDSSRPNPGDEIMVLPKIETKNVEVARGLSQIIYQIAVSAKVVFGL